MTERAFLGTNFGPGVRVVSGSIAVQYAQFKFSRALTDREWDLVVSAVMHAVEVCRLVEAPPGP